MSLGLCGFIIGLIGISDGLIPQWVCFTVIGISICLMIFFVYYNLKCSKTPIFPHALFNRSTLLCVFFILLNNTIFYTERFFVP